MGSDLCHMVEHWTRPESRTKRLVREITEGLTEACWNWSENPTEGTTKLGGGDVEFKSLQLCETVGFFEIFNIIEMQIFFLLVTNASLLNSISCMSNIDIIVWYWFKVGSWSCENRGNDCTPNNSSLTLKGHHTLHVLAFKFTRDMVSLCQQTIAAWRACCVAHHNLSQGGSFVYFHM